MTDVTIAAADARFWMKVGAGENGCWNWLGNRSAKGYGNFHAGSGRRVVRAHRWAYERYVGPIPEGLTIDHLCRNTSCVNPAHMEVVSSGVNTLRGGAASAVNARKTHCYRGHEFTPDNTRIDHKGGRVCVACKRERDARSKRERYAKARAAA